MRLWEFCIKCNENVQLTAAFMSLWARYLIKSQIKYENTNTTFLQQLSSSTFLALEVMLGWDGGGCSGNHWSWSNLKLDYKIQKSKKQELAASCHGWRIKWKTMMHCLENIENKEKISDKSWYWKKAHYDLFHHITQKAGFEKLILWAIANISLRNWSTTYCWVAHHNLFRAGFTIFWSCIPFCFIFCELLAFLWNTSQW